MMSVPGNPLPVTPAGLGDADRSLVSDGRPLGADTIDADGFPNPFTVTERDVLQGGGGPDDRWLGSGGDHADGGDGDDSIDGERGADELFGGRGRGRLSGGAGADTLDGGRGNDTLTGGRGSDVFVFSGGRDRVFDLRSNDLIRIEDALGCEPTATAAWSCSPRAGR